MNRRKHWTITAVVLIVIGLLIGVAALASIGFDFKRLSMTEYATNTYDVKDSFHRITIKAHTEKIALLPSENETCTVVCHEDVNNPHKVRVEKDTLVIDSDWKFKWYIDFGALVEKQSITVYLPETIYQALSIDGDTGDVNIPADFTFDSIDVKLDTGDLSCRASVTGDLTVRTDTGKIELRDLSAGNISLKTDTGRNELVSITCTSLSSKGDTGSITMTDVIVSGPIRIERDTGSVRFDNCDAESIFVETDTGSVKGTLLTEKTFITKTDTGSIDVPRTTGGEICEIKTDTGDIRIEISEP